MIAAATFWETNPLPVVAMVLGTFLMATRLPGVIAPAKFREAAARAFVQWRKFGVSVLELTTTPAAVGGQLVGILRTRAPLAARDGLQLRLSCVNRVTTGSGKNRSTSEHIRWQEEQHILKDRDVPVFFRLPDDAEPSSPESSDNCIVWRLEAKAAVPGVDYHATFDVPVFRVTGSPAPQADTAASFRLEPKVYEPPRDSRITFDRYATGGPTFYFPAARNPGAAASLTAFTLLWTGAIGLQLHFKAPLVFPIVTGLFDLLFVVILAQLWFASARVVVTQAGVTVTKRLLGWERTRTIAKADLAEIKLYIGMQSGNTPYYDIRLRLTNGRVVTAAGSIRDKRQIGRAHV